MNAGFKSYLIFECLKVGTTIDLHDFPNDSINILSIIVLVQQFKGQHVCQYCQNFENTHL